MNTPGKHDGKLRALFDDRLALYMDTIRFRDTDEFSIDGLLFSPFFGGETVPGRQTQMKQCILTISV